MQIKQQTFGHDNIPWCDIYGETLDGCIKGDINMGDVHTVEEERPLLEVACI